MLRFQIRDLLWLMVVVGPGVRGGTCMCGLSDSGLPEQDEEARIALNTRRLNEANFLKYGGRAGGRCFKTVAPDPHRKRCQVIASSKCWAGVGCDAVGGRAGQGVLPSPDGRNAPLGN